MQRRLFTFGIFAWLFVSFLIGGFVFAQDFGINQAGNIGGGALGTADIRDVIVNITNITLGFLGIVAVLIIIYGGWVWMTAGGSPERVDTAKKILRNAVIGLAIIIASWALVRFLIIQFSLSTGGNVFCTYVAPPGVGNPTQSCNAGCGTQVCQPGDTWGTCVGTCPVIPPGQFLTLYDWYPRNNLAVCLNTIVFAHFDDIIDDTSVTSNFNVYTCLDQACNNVGAPVSGTATSQIAGVNTDTVVFTLSPGTFLQANTSYRVIITSSASSPTSLHSINSKYLFGDFSWDFGAGTLIDNTPPQVDLTLPNPTVPANGQIDVCRETYLRADFNEVMNPQTINGSSITVQSSNGGQVPQYSVSAVNLGTHSALLAEGPNPIHDDTKLYDITIHETVEDACGNPLDSDADNIGGENPQDKYGGRPVSGNPLPWEFETGATVACLPEIDSISGTGYYDTNNPVNWVVINGNYLEDIATSKPLDITFGNNASTFTNSCLSTFSPWRADSSCYVTISSPISQGTYLPAGIFGGNSAQIGIGARDGIIKVTTSAGSASSASSFDVKAPFIEAINTGRINTISGLPAASFDQFISIHGEDFGTIPGNVWLTEWQIIPKRFLAAPVCVGSGGWDDNTIIVAVPVDMEATGIPNSTYDVQVEITVGPDLHFSNLGQIHFDDVGAGPGLCSVNPTAGNIGTLIISGSGENFESMQIGAEELRFGSLSSSINAGGTPLFSRNSLIPDTVSGGTVPSMQPQNGVGVFVTDGVVSSNSLLFDVKPSTNGPIIYDFIASYDTSGNPIRSGGLGQYLTITGTHFGDTPGDVLFYPSAPYGGTGISGDFNFPIECLNVLWSDTQIIVKIPFSLLAQPGLNYIAVVDANGLWGTTENLTTSRFNQNGASPTPGICALVPTNGVAGQSTNIYGDNLASVNQVWFYDTLQATSIGTVANQSLTNAVVPVGAITGPLTAEDNGTFSNPLQFSIGLCNDPAASISCLSNNSCCSGGTFDGQCRPDFFDGSPSCDEQPTESLQTWTFSTGVGVGATCDLDPLANLCQQDSILCNNSNLICQINSCTCQKFAVALNNTCTVFNQSPSPAPSQVDACINSVVNVRFNDRIDISRTNLDKITIEKCGSSSSNGDCATPKTIQSMQPAFSYSSDSALFISSTRKDDTVGISPPVGNLEEDRWYRVTVPGGPAGFLSEDNGVSPTKLQASLEADYTWMFKTEPTGVQCAPDMCFIAPAYGATVYSLVPLYNSYIYTLFSTKACNLIRSLSIYTLSSNDTSVGVPSQLVAGLSSPAYPTMLGVGKGQTELVATHAINTSLQCHAEFIVDTVVPQVINTWPNCDTACLNATIGVDFSTWVNVLFKGSTFLYECSTLTSCAVVGSAINKGIATDKDFLDLSSSGGGQYTTGVTWSPQSSLKPNTRYMMEISNLANASSPSSEQLLPNNTSGTYTWEFTTKTDINGSGLCSIDHITLEPDLTTLHYITERANITGIAYSAPDDCSLATGQKINALAYDWQDPNDTTNYGWFSLHSTVVTYFRNLLLYPPTGFDDFIPPPSGDGLLDPTQRVQAVGLIASAGGLGQLWDCSDSRGYCIDTVQGTVDPNPIINGDEISCADGGLNKCAEVKLICGQQTDAQCGAFGSGLGVADSSCCGPRPSLTASVPVDDTTNVCLNQLITIDADMPLDHASVQGYVYLTENVGPNPCPAGANSLLAQGDSTTRYARILPANPIKRFVFYVKEFFRHLFIKEADASHNQFYSPGDNLCIVPASIQFVDIVNQIHITPTVLLDTNTQYVAVVLGDDNLTDGNKVGIQSNLGVTFAGPTLIQRGSKNYNSQLFTFETGTEICEIDSIETWFFDALGSRINQPEENYFCATNTCPDDGENLFTWVPNFVGNQHLFWAFSRDANGNPLANVDYQYIRGGPEFYELCIGGPTPLGPCDTTISGGTDLGLNQVTVSNTYPQYQQDARGSISITATNNYLPSNVISKTIGLHLFACVNPWPDQANFPYVDSPTNCIGTLPGTCVDTKFEFYYCRDAGAQGTFDDLPALEYNNPVIVPFDDTKKVCIGGTDHGQTCNINPDCSTNACLMADRICFGGSTPGGLCSSSVPGYACECLPGDSSCSTDGVCVQAHLKDLVFPRGGTLASPDIFTMGLPTAAKPQTGGDLEMTSWSHPGGTINYSYILYWGTSPGNYTYSRNLGAGFFAGNASRLSNLDPVQDYYFGLTAYSGNTESAPIEFGPIKPIDEVAPAPAPGSFVVSWPNIGAGEITLSWSPSTTPLDVAGYEIILSRPVSTLVYETRDVGNVLTYTFTGLTVGSNYNFELYTYDKAGNRSVRGPFVSANAL